MNYFFKGFEKKAVSVKWLVGKMKSGIKTRARKDPHIVQSHELRKFDDSRRRKHWDIIGSRDYSPGGSYLGGLRTKATQRHWRSGTETERNTLKDLVQEAKKTPKNKGV
jgi:hypothetical protein